jgi:enoyl-CoA hydratase
MTIHYSVDEHIATIVIDRPEARNALDPEHAKGLADAWRRYRDDEAARVAVVTGVGTSFCAGYDLKASATRSTQRTGGPSSGSDGSSDLFVAMLRDFDLFKPVIAAVNGVCAGAGLEMLCGVDIRVACPEARFGVPEPKRGLMAAGGTTARLPRQIPFPFAMEFLLTGNLFDAAAAFSMGLLNKVVPAEGLMEAALEYARTIAANAPVSVRLTKQSAVQGLGLNLKDAYANELSLIPILLQSEDSREGPRAFAEKRPPVWKGR